VVVCVVCWRSSRKDSAYSQRTFVLCFSNK
jgi:hypothetical protein